MTNPSSGEVPQVECGCGFRVVGLDEERNAELFDNHNCFDGREGVPNRWHESVFSGPGILVILGLAFFAAIVLSDVYGHG